MDKARKIKSRILDLIAERDFRGVKKLVVDLLPADALSLIEELDTLERVIVFRLLPKRTAAEVFTELPTEKETELLRLVPNKNLAVLFEQLDPDDRAAVLDEFPAGVVRDLLKVISPEERAMTSTLLGYPEDSAGRIMTPEYVDLHASMTVENAIERIRNVGPDRETIYTCYVIGPHRKLVGSVSLKDILLAPEGVILRDIMTPEPKTVSTHDDQEHAAAVGIRYDLLSVPVVDAESRLVGIITIDDITDVLHEEVGEDVYRMAGMEELENSYFNTGFFTLFRRRIFWLLLFMGAQAFAGGILRHYQDSMTEIIALIFFIPMLIGSAGNTGTQAATLVIRGLATGEINIAALGRVISRELLMGMLLGGLLGIAGGTIALLMGQEPLLFVAVTISFMCTILTANVIGAGLPLLFEKLGLDPALMAGPVISTIVDVGGLLIYFQIAKVVFDL